MPNTRTSKSRRRGPGGPQQNDSAQLLGGRARDLAQLLECIAEPGTAAVLVGVVGSGRSTLLDEVRASSTIKSVRITPHPWEKFRQFGGLSMVLNTIDDPRIADGIAGFADKELSVEGTLRAADELLQLLTGGQREETLLLIDDADGFDEHSQLALTYLAGRLGGTGLRMLMSVTPESTFTAFAGIRSVWISRLDLDSAMELAHSVAPADADEQTLSIVCDASGGLPGMIRSAITLLTKDQVEGLAPLALPLYPGPAPLTYEAWEHETLLLLRRLSTAPLCSVSALPQFKNGNRDRFEKLTSQGVLELNGPFVSIRDGALRSALYWSMTSAQREELHRIAAADEADHSAALSLWHADHVDMVTDSSAMLLRGAGTLFAEGLVDAATELAERALLLSLGVDEILDELLVLCDQLTLQSEFGLAVRYLSQCKQAAKEPTQLAECLRLEVTIASLTDDKLDVGAIDVYAHRYRRDNPGASAELLSFAALALATAGDIASARTHIDDAYATRTFDRVPTGSVQNWTRRLLDGIDGLGNGPALTSTDATVSTNADVDELDPSIQLIRGRALMVEERYDEARHVFRSLELSIPRRARGTAWTARLRALSARNEMRAGRVAEASALIDALAELGPTQNLSNLMLFAWNEAVMRDRPDAEPLLAEARIRAARTHQPVLSAQLLALEGSLSLMHGDLDDARFRFARAYEPGLEMRPDVLRLEGDFVEVLARRGEWEAARRVATRFAERSSKRPSHWSETVLARSRAIVAPDNEAIREFRTALSIAQDNGMPFETARTRLSFAFTLERFGDVQRAGEQRRAAEFGFETLSAIGWIAAARDAATSVESPLRNSLLATLTEHELAVLRLMRKGVRNKDIAAALFVSLRTVEVRITQIYRKLEARSRSHLLTLLPTDLDQHDPF
jgi:DNA-binding CsgD family transcriptional regulator/tetratricopeptide (TPR) repeat protein